MADYHLKLEQAVADGQINEADVPTDEQYFSDNFDKSVEQGQATNQDPASFYRGMDDYIMANSNIPSMQKSFLQMKSSILVNGVFMSEPTDPTSALSFLANHTNYHIIKPSAEDDTANIGQLIDVEFDTGDSKGYKYSGALTGDLLSCYGIKTKIELVAQTVHFLDYRYILEDNTTLKNSLDIRFTFTDAYGNSYQVEKQISVDFFKEEVNQNLLSF
jgi:hypothetical protein